MPGLFGFLSRHGLLSLFGAGLAGLLFRGRRLSSLRLLRPGLAGLLLRNGGDFSGGPGGFSSCFHRCGFDSGGSSLPATGRGLGGLLGLLGGIGRSLRTVTGLDNSLHAGLLLGLGRNDLVVLVVYGGQRRHANLGEELKLAEFSFLRQVGQ